MEGNLQSDNIKFCEILQRILRVVQQHYHAEPFLFPVKTSVAPGYYDVIKNPMDLDTMHNKIKEFQYFSLAEFISDFELIVNNCEIYNRGTNSEILIEWVNELYEEFYREIKKYSKETLSPFGDTPEQTEQMEQMEQIEPIIDQIEPIDQINIDQIDLNSNLEDSGNSVENRGSLHYIIDNDNWDMTKSEDSWSNGIFDCPFFPEHGSHVGHYYDQVHDGPFDFGRYMNQL